MDWRAVEERYKDVLPSRTSDRELQRREGIQCTTWISVKFRTSCLGCHPRQQPDHPATLLKITGRVVNETACYSVLPDGGISLSYLILKAAIALNYETLS